MIMLDVDWAGMHGVHVYLADVNPYVAPLVSRPTSVRRGAVMLQSHDLKTIQSECTLGSQLAMCIALRTYLESVASEQACV